MAERGPDDDAVTEQPAPVSADEPPDLYALPASLEPLHGEGAAAPEAQAAGTPDYVIIPRPVGVRSVPARGALPITILGVVIALIALLVLQWPVPTDDAGVQTKIHIARLVERLASGNIGGAALDTLIYALVVAAIALAVLAWRRGSRSGLFGLAMVGLLGLAYSGSTALYTGPMVSICGFSLILFGGLLAFVVQGTTPDNGDEAGIG